MLRPRLGRRATLRSACQSSSVGISGSFAVDDELFDHADEQLDASLTLANADHAGTTDLVEDRRRALIA
jgi:hypothetical protein